MPLGYKSDGETVTLTMTRDDFNILLISLGYTAGAASEREDPTAFYNSLALVNRLNEGNPNFVPYEIPDEETGSRP